MKKFSQRKLLAIFLFFIEKFYFKFWTNYFSILKLFQYTEIMCLLK
jgi:hypothetical protein